MSREIEQGKRRVRDVQAGLEAERQLHRPKANEAMAEDTSDRIETYDFWCVECEEDFAAPAVKHVHRIYGDPVVTYRTQHECGEECVRLISHRDHDPYYQRSAKVRRQRNLYTAETLRPEDRGFSTLYGRPQFDKQLQEMEENAIRSERERGFKGLSQETKEKLERIRNQ